MVSKKRIYGGRDPRDIPTYSVHEAARFLRLPESTLQRWVRGQADTRKGPQAVILTEDSLLSFWNLAEAYVLAGIRRGHGVKLQSVRRALDYVRRKVGHQRPLIEQDFLTNGVDLFVEKLGEFTADGTRKTVDNASRGGQLADRALIVATLQRVDRDTKGLISRIYPWGGQIEEPRHVEIDPRRAYGRPVIAGTIVPTESLVERWRAGDSMQDIARDFRVKVEAVEGALRWEASAAAA